MRRPLARLAAALFLAAAAWGGPAAAAPFTSLVAFGDSLTDRGNLYALTGGRVPVAPAYAGGQFSNGATWIETLSQRLGLGATAPSLLGGGVYAYGLARSDAQAPGLGVPDFINLPGQVASYVNGPSAGPDALFAVWAGANNLLQALAVGLNPASGLPDPLAYIRAEAAAAAASLLVQLDLLRADGATEFLVLNQPNLGRTPRFNGDPVTAAAGLLASTVFNEELAAGLAALDAQPGVRVFGLDIFGLFEKVAATPAAFGLTDVTSACVTGPVPAIYLDPTAATIGCTPGEAATRAFWDPVHPTAAVHALIGELAAVAVPEPASLGLLLTGLAGLAALRRRGEARAAAGQP